MGAFAGDVRRRIRAAAKAHLCWVYLAYGDRGVIDLDHPMMRGLWFHRHSAIKSEVDYAVMTTPSLLVGGDRRAARQATLNLIADDNYQRTTIAGASRPVLFLYVETSEADRWIGAAATLRDALDGLRAASRERGLGDPYLVLTLSGADKAEALRAAIGADAISQYVAGRRRGHEAWAAFEPGIEADWDRYAAATRADVVPTLRSGADIRARCETRRRSSIVSPRARAATITSTTPTCPNSNRNSAMRAPGSMHSA